MSRGFLYWEQLWKVDFSSTFRTKRGEFTRASRAGLPRIAHSFWRECYRWPRELVQNVLALLLKSVVFACYVRS